MIENPVVTKGLKKVLGFGSLFIIAIGFVVSQASVVSIQKGECLGGGSFFIAIVIAFLLTPCYISTYSELAPVMPKAGCISTYTAVSIGHFPAIIAFLAITTTSGLISSALAAIPRLLYGMAHHKHLPAIFMRLHPKWKTPWFSIFGLAGLITIPMWIFGKNPDALLMLLISAASCWLLSYIIAHIDLIVLRKKYPVYLRPFTSPLFPLPQLVGIAGMAYAFCNNAPTPELRLKVYVNTALFIGLTALFAFVWVRYSMKKGLFEAENIKQAISD